MQAQMTRVWCRRPETRTHEGVTFPIDSTDVGVGEGLSNKIAQADGCFYLSGCGRFTKRYVDEKHMKIFVGFLFVLISTISQAEGIDDILKRSPIEAAQEAHGAGDTSLLTVPGCFNGMPGYKGQFGPPKKWRKFWKSCEELFGVEQYKKIQDLEEWAKLYNGYILEHREK